MSPAQDRRLHFYTLEEALTCRPLFNEEVLNETRKCGLMRRRRHDELSSLTRADFRTSPMAWVEKGYQQKHWGAGWRGLPGQQRARRGMGTLLW